MNLMIVVLVAALMAGTWGWMYWNHADPMLLRFRSGEQIESPGTFSYDTYARTHTAHVNVQGLVNYQGLKAARAGLDTFAGSLANAQPDKWESREKIAFWINAYNALTLEAIVQNYPIRSSLFRSALYPKNSIRQIPGVWDKLRFVVAGEELTLDDIEHRILRTQFHEPRIHMALVCAAMSCPPLWHEPYTGEKLEQQLDDQARVFLSSPYGFRADRAQGKVYLSSIFKWFAQDFVKKYGTSELFAGKSETERAVLNFVSQYVSASDREFLMNGRYGIEYLDYDWTLNEKSAQ